MSSRKMHPHTAGSGSITSSPAPRSRLTTKSNSSSLTSSMYTRSATRKLAQKSVESAADPSSVKLTSSVDHERNYSDINWVFFDDSHRNDKPCYTQIPIRLYKGKSSNCRDHFVKELHDEFDFVTQKNKIRFFQPKEQLLCDTVISRSPTWMDGIDKDTFNTLFEPIPLILSFARVVNWECNENHIQLIVTAVGTYINSIQERQTDRDEAPDMLMNLPETQSYCMIVKNPGSTPSCGAQSTQYTLTQGVKYKLIHDGRYPPFPEISTVAPPVELFCQAFGNFISLVEDPSFQPDNKYLADVQEFMYKLSIIGDPDGEMLRNDRNAFIRDKLRTLWGLELDNDENMDGTKVDGEYSIWIPRVKTIIMLMDLKRELGEGGCDPSIQAGLSMRRAWIQYDRTAMRNKCCCPTLMIVCSGPWFGVLGGVFTDKIIVQRLTDMMWIGHASTHDDLRVYRFARLLDSIRECILELEDFYWAIARDEDIPPKPCGTSPRFYPYPKTFRENGKTVVFTYVKRLKLHAGCVTYQAKTTGGEDIIVRFVSRYGEDVHEFLAGHNLAPRLRYCGPLSGELEDQDEDEAPPPLHASTGLWLGPMRMVVMDYITTQRDKSPTNAFEQLAQVLELLHPAGYVLGDLRFQNVLFDTDGKIKLIDFDWSGRFDMSIQDKKLPDRIQKMINDNKALVTPANVTYARYPLNMSETVKLVSGVRDLAPIRPQHDWIMLKKMKQYL